MGREYTNFLKGIAILMMLWLHLFNNIDADKALGCLIWIGDTPLVYSLTYACNPVPFFLILSGYGLYAAYKRGGVKPYKRVINLYLHLWLIYLLLLPMASFVRPDFYPGSWVTFLKNATSWQCSYIGEQWFFLPYIILMISSKGIFKVFDKLKGWIVVFVTFAIYAITLYFQKKYGPQVLWQNMLFYNIFLSFSMLFPFSLGYLANRYKHMEKVKTIFAKIPIRDNFLASLCLLVLCTIVCFIGHSSIGSIYAYIFILIFSTIKVGNGFGKILTFFGKHSMNIWLIHTWFCTRLFHSLFYDKLHYPLLMYVTLLCISVAVSYFVEVLFSTANKYLNRLGVMNSPHSHYSGPK